MNSTIIDEFGQISPIACIKLKFIAGYCVVLLTLSLVFNTTLIFIFISHKKLRTTLNMFVLTLTILNLFGSIFEFGFVIPSNWSCR